MRQTSPRIRDRQERALVLALSGMPVTKIADCLGYKTTSGAWKALRSAAARKTDTTPAAVQGHLRSFDKLLRAECQTRALQGVLADAAQHETD